jgi:hypothetical protein
MRAAMIAKLPTTVRYGTAMPDSDHDIHRSAHQLIQLHGDAAMAKAREMVEEMRRQGDHEGADKWLRIIVAIGELDDPPSDARH